MRDARFAKHVGTALALLAGAGFFAGLGAAAGLAASAYTVSQKGREFTPNKLAIKRAETLTIVNDDADLHHHVYINAANFNFDSGDQKPGSKIDVTFPVAGSFEVLCAIHPKMRLVVAVE
jgi:plastocyanin